MGGTWWKDPPEGYRNSGKCRADISAIVGNSVSACSVVLKVDWFVLIVPGRLGVDCGVRF